jgi:glycine cleavage system regulatory protein
MQMKMSFLEPQAPDGAAPVWVTLDAQQRAEVVTALARLMVKLATGRDDPRGVPTKETSDE